MRITLFLLILVTYLGCGQADKVLPQGGQPNNPQNIFLGDWTGYITYKSDDRVEKITARFTENNAEFIVEDNKAKTAGDYRFSNDNLFLEVKESNLSSLGLVDQTVKFNFDLRGQDLRLENRTSVLDLERSSSGGTGQEDGVFGSWACSDKLQNTWIFVFEDPNIVRTQVFRGTNVINFSGTLVWLIPDESANYVVETSDVATGVGAIYELTFTEENKMIVKVSNDLFECKKS